MGGGEGGRAEDSRMHGLGQDIARHAAAFADRAEKPSVRMNMIW